MFRREVRYPTEDSNDADLIPRAETEESRVLTLTYNVPIEESITSIIASIVPTLPSVIDNLFLTGVSSDSTYAAIACAVRSVD